LFVTGDFFRVLGVRPIQGRVFATTDDREGCGLPGAVISDEFWQRELGGDADGIDRTMRRFPYVRRQCCGAKGIGSMKEPSGG
jgi:hypothetical protein